MGVILHEPNNKEIDGKAERLEKEDEANNCEIDSFCVGRLAVNKISTIEIKSIEVMKSDCSSPGKQSKTSSYSKISRKRSILREKGSTKEYKTKNYSLKNNAKIQLSDTGSISIQKMIDIPSIVYNDGIDGTLYL